MPYSNSEFDVARAHQFTAGMRAINKNITDELESLLSLVKAFNCSKKNKPDRFVIWLESVIADFKAESSTPRFTDTFQ